MGILLAPYHMSEISTSSGDWRQTLAKMSFIVYCAVDPEPSWLMKIIWMFYKTLTPRICLFTRSVQTALVKSLINSSFDCNGLTLN